MLKPVFTFTLWYVPFPQSRVITEHNGGSREAVSLVALVMTGVPVGGSVARDPGVEDFCFAGSSDKEL